MKTVSLERPNHWRDQSLGDRSKFSAKIWTFSHVNDSLKLIMWNAFRIEPTHQISFVKMNLCKTADIHTKLKNSQIPTVILSILKWLTKKKAKRTIIWYALIIMLINNSYTMHCILHIIIILLFWEFFTAALADGFLFEFEWQQVS